MFFPSMTPKVPSGLDKESILIIAVSSLLGIVLYICKLAMFPEQKKELEWSTKLGSPIFNSSDKRFQIKMLHGHTSKECEATDLQEPKISKLFNNLKESKEWAQSRVK